MKSSPPQVTTLTHWLARCPQEFLAEPKIGDEEGVSVDAVVADLLFELQGHLATEDEVRGFRTNTHLHRAHLRLVLVACWLLSEPSLKECVRERGAADEVRCWLEKELFELSGFVDAEQCVVDEERREELVRRALRAVGVVPEGETAAQAGDRLTMLDSIERHRLMADTRQRVLRAEELRRKMAEQRAREAAARYTRE